MNLHIVFHGMMVFDDRDEAVSAKMPETPAEVGAGMEHAYRFYPSSDWAAFETLKGDYLVEVASAGTGRAEFSAAENVLFAKETAIKHSHVVVSLPPPQHITGVRFCQKMSGKDFFKGSPNNPDKLPTAHVLSYSDVTSVIVTGPGGFRKVVTAEGESFKMAFHSEEPTFAEPNPNHDSHLRHIRIALGKPGFQYITAMVPPAAAIENILGDSIEAFWSESIPEKAVPVSTLSPSPGNARSPTEDNPCFRYVVTDRSNISMQKRSAS